MRSRRRRRAAAAAGREERCERQLGKRHQCRAQRGIEATNDFPDTQAGSVQAMYDSFSSQLRPLPELNSESLQALSDRLVSAFPEV